MKKVITSRPVYNRNKSKSFVRDIETKKYETQIIFLITLLSLPDSVNYGFSLILNLITIRYNYWDNASV